MKTLHTAALLLLLFALTASAYTRPALPPLAPSTRQPPPASSGQLGQLLLRYRYLQDTELPQLLAWLRDWGPFTQPPPGLLPNEVATPALADR